MSKGASVEMLNPGAEGRAGFGCECDLISLDVFVLISGGIRIDDVQD